MAEKSDDRKVSFDPKAFACFASAADRNPAYRKFIQAGEHDPSTHGEMTEEAFMAMLERNRKRPIIKC